MKGLALLHGLLLALLAAPGLADTALPALHDVKGVAADDVLNVRAAPDAASTIIGRLAPDLEGIEVLGRDESGRWGLVNVGEQAGWAALRFLAPQDRPAWFALQGELHCSGTEPFWSAGIDPAGARQLLFSAPDQNAVPFGLPALWPGEAWRPVAGLSLAGETASGMAVIRAESCSDGMSDRAYGLSVDLFLEEGPGGGGPALRGCCTLAP